MLRRSTNSRLVMVTGSDGFIGRHVTQTLVRLGWLVCAVDRRAVVAPPSDSRIIHHTLDVASKDFTRLLRSTRPEAVIHLAAQSSLDALERQPEQGIRDNIIATANLVEACIGSSTRKIVFASSAAVYGAAKTFPVREDATVRPISAYGWSKAAGEQLVMRAGAQHGLEYAILRLSNVYGPGQEAKPEPGVIALWLGALLEGERLRIRTEGNPTRDFVFVGDVAEAIAAATIQGTAEVLNVSSGQETSLIDLLHLACQVAGEKSQPTVYAAPPGDIERSALNPTRALHALGWKALTPLELGLKRTWSYLSTSGWRQRAATAGG